jgi:hypothetical protein
MLAFVSSWISIAIYVIVAVMWLVPDRRIENVFGEKGKSRFRFWHLADMWLKLGSVCFWGQSDIVELPSNL